MAGPGLVVYHVFALCEEEVIKTSRTVFGTVEKSLREMYEVPCA